MYQSTAQFNVELYGLGLKLPDARFWHILLKNGCQWQYVLSINIKISNYWKHTGTCIRILFYGYHFNKAIFDRLLVSQIALKAYAWYQRLSQLSLCKTVFGSCIAILANVMNIEPEDMLYVS